MSLLLPGLLSCASPPYVIGLPARRFSFGKAQTAFASPGAATIIGPAAHLAGRGEIWHVEKNRTGMLSNFSGTTGTGMARRQIARADAARAISDGHETCFELV
jgi:hypothetical protein